MACWSGRRGALPLALILTLTLTRTGEAHELGLGLGLGLGSGLGLGLGTNYSTTCWSGIGEAHEPEESLRVLDVDRRIVREVAYASASA